MRDPTAPEIKPVKPEPVTLDAGKTALLCRLDPKRIYQINSQGCHKAKITTVEQLNTYNATLSSMATSFPVPTILASFAPDALFALPIIWEAPDNMASTLPGGGGAPGLATHDCRHLHMDPAFTVDAGPCTDIPGTYPAGGITTIVATVTDGFSREQIDDFGGV